MSDGIVMRIHRVRSEVVVAACDQELLGQNLPIGKAGKTVKITSDFYGERAVSREEVVWAIRRGTIINLLGRRVLELATSEGFVTEGGYGTLGGIPHAEIISMPE
ncbi:MAG: DUF424 family protein [Thermoplasmata archaeon]|nr:DUF424 family protein [Thermoplasmata archaeon]